MIVENEKTNGPWDGVSWVEIVQEYESIYKQWKSGVSVEPPNDCPADHLLPAMLVELPPDLEEVWNKGDAETESGIEMTNVVFEKMGFFRICFIREAMGATD